MVAPHLVCDALPDTSFDEAVVDEETDHITIPYELLDDDDDDEVHRLDRTARQQHECASSGRVDSLQEGIQRVSRQWEQKIFESGHGVSRV